MAVAVVVQVQQQLQVQDLVQEVQEEQE